MDIRYDILTPNLSKECYTGSRGSFFHTDCKLVLSTCPIYLTWIFGKCCSQNNYKVIQADKTGLVAPRGHLQLYSDWRARHWTEDEAVLHCECPLLRLIHENATAPINNKQYLDLLERVMQLLLRLCLFFLCNKNMESSQEPTSYNKLWNSLI